MDDFKKKIATLAQTKGGWSGCFCFGCGFHRGHAYKKQASRAARKKLKAEVKKILKDEEV